MSLIENDTHPLLLKAIHRARVAAPIPPENTNVKVLEATTLLRESERRAASLEGQLNAIKLERQAEKTRLAHSNVVKAAIPVVRPFLIFRSYPTAEDILRVVSDFYEISVIDIKSQRRTANFTKPRHVAMFLMRSLTLMSLPVIGKAIGGRDHTTALHGADKISGIYMIDDRFRDEIDLLKIKISDLLERRNAGLARPVAPA